MVRFDSPSRCSAGSQISFRWYGFPQCNLGEDLDAAVEKLISAVSGENRVWNPYARAMVNAEFKRRIQKAAAGKLKPVDEVKPIDVANPPPLYEIRWQEIPVTEVDSQGNQIHKQVLVRMYHSEPSSLPAYFVGHHAHEKLVDVEDVNAVQQDEIRAAIRWHNHGEGSLWGIAT